MCPPDVREGAACKDFCQIRTIRVQYEWEPVMWRCGRSDRSGWLTDVIVRDWINYGNRPAARTADSLTGSKPMAFSAWASTCLARNPATRWMTCSPAPHMVMALAQAHARAATALAFSELFA